jgi:thioredoxin-like negative regulator of GroEL
MPTLEKLEKEYEGKMKFVKLDVSESRDFGNIVLNGLAIRDLVNSVPYILMVRKGRIVESFPHVATPIILRAAIDKVVA